MKIAIELWRDVKVSLSMKKILPDFVTWCFFRGSSRQKSIEKTPMIALSRFIIKEFNAKQICTYLHRNFSESSEPDIKVLMHQTCKITRERRQSVFRNDFPKRSNVFFSMIRFKCWSYAEQLLYKAWSVQTSYRSINARCQWVEESAAFVSCD